MEGATTMVPAGSESKRVASFEIGFTRLLDADGSPCEPLPDFAQDPATLIGL